jgi:hypothetical protein
VTPAERAIVPARRPVKGAAPHGRRRVPPAAPAAARESVRDGVRDGVVIAAVVAAWLGLRLAWGAADAPDVRPLLEAVRFARAFGAPTAVPLMPAVLVGACVAGAALIGGGVAVVAGRGPQSRRQRLVVAGALAAVEYALWWLTAWHTGPWLRAAVWYHLAITTLVVITVLERARASAPARRGPRRPRGARGTRERPPATRERPPATDGHGRTIGGIAPRANAAP